MSLSLYTGFAFLGSYMVSNELNYNTDSATRKMFTLAHFNACMALPFVSLAIETGHPAYAGLAVLSLGHVFWAAREINTHFHETRYGDVKRGIIKAMRVMAGLLVIPAILYSLHAYSALKIKV